MLAAPVEKNDISSHKTRSLALNTPETHFFCIESGPRNVSGGSICRSISVKRNLKIEGNTAISGCTVCHRVNAYEKLLAPGHGSLVIIIIIIRPTFVSHCFVLEVVNN